MILLKQLIYVINKKSRKVYNFSEYFLSIVFLRDMHEWHFSLKDGDD